MELIRFSEASVYVRTTRRSIPDDSTILLLEFAILPFVKMAITSDQSAHIQNNFQFMFIAVLPSAFCSKHEVINWIISK
jgi:hypothetical protein